MRHFLLAPYLLLVFFVVFVVGNEYRFSHRFAEARSINFFPFKEKIYFFQHPEIWGGNNLQFMVKEIAGNMLLLFPLPIILILFYRIQNGFVVIAYSLLLSCLIETVQGITDMGSSDIDDIILNTLGAAGGILLARWISRQPGWASIRIKFRL